MASRSREKAALIVFSVLIVLSLCGFGWYLLVGHSWNVAASNIDDTFGSMDGYTAIVYKGTQELQTSSAASTSSGSSPSASETTSSSSASSASSFASSGADSDSLDDATSQNGTSATDSSSAAVDSDTAEGADVADNGEGSDAAQNGDDAEGVGGNTATQNAGQTSTSRSSSLTDEVPLAIDDVKDSYEEKGATVFALDTEDIGRYSEGTILKKGGHRFGVFSVDEPTSTIMLEKRIAEFTRCEVDFIVVLTSSKAYVDDVEGIDIAICTADEELFVMGETIEGTFYVDTPEEGKVGAILISPSNVVSAKVIKEL